MITSVSSVHCHVATYHSFDRKTEHPKLFLSKELQTLIKNSTLYFPMCSRTVHKALVIHRTEYLAAELSKFCQ